MNILINIGHPAHVHFFKFIIKRLEKKSHNIKIIAKEKDVTLSLLENLNFPYQKISNYYSGIVDKFIDLLVSEYKFIKICQDFKPDLLMGIGDHYVTHMGKLFSKPSLYITDSEPVPIVNAMSTPFMTYALTPDCFGSDFGKKHKRYNGYHELAYLSPKYFKPNSEIFNYLGVKKDEPYVIVRFVSWGASHDINESGLFVEQKLKAVESLSKFCRVFISSEDKLPHAFKKYMISIPPHLMHDAMYHATLLFGDSQTMTTEAAILGTPAVRSNSFVGENDMMNFVELEKKYNLIFNYRKFDEALDKCISLLKSKNLKLEWREKAKILHDDKEDVVDFFVNFIDNIFLR